DLAARTAVARDTARLDRRENAVSGPAGAQHLVVHEHIALVGGAHDVFRGHGRPQAWQRGRQRPNSHGVAPPSGAPFGPAAKLDAAEYGLHLEHARVGAYAVMQPAELARIRRAPTRFRTLAVILVGPGQRRQGGVVGGDHAALPAGGDDLVLAKRPCCDMAETADRSAAVHGPV